MSHNFDPRTATPAQAIAFLAYCKYSQATDYHEDMDDCEASFRWPEQSILYTETEDGRELSVFVDFEANMVMARVDGVAAALHKFGGTDGAARWLYSQDWDSVWEFAHDMERFPEFYGDEW